MKTRKIKPIPLPKKPKQTGSVDLIFEKPAKSGFLFFNKNVSEQIALGISG